MSAHPLSKVRVPIAINLAREPSRGVNAMTLRWGVSRRALGDRAPAGTSALVHLLLSVGSDQSPRWALRDPGSASVPPLDLDLDLPPPGKTVISPHGDGLLLVRGPHIDAIVRPRDGGAQLLYARTPIFKALSIPGGRYRVLGVDIHDT